MSRENVELVRRAFDAWEQNDLQAMLDLMADDFVTYRSTPDGASYHGKEEFFRATADWIEGFSEWSVRPEAFIDAGDQVVVRVRQIARSKTSGVRIEEDWWFVYEIRDANTISKLSYFSSQQQALEAAGLSE